MLPAENQMQYMYIGIAAITQCTHVPNEKNVQIQRKITECGDMGFP